MQPSRKRRKPVRPNGVRFVMKREHTQVMMTVNGTLSVIVFGGMGLVVVLVLALRHLM